MLAKRIIPCLDVRNGAVVKGVSFQELREMGDPETMAARYAEDGADEIVLLDVTASVENRTAVLDLVRRIRKRIAIPFSIGGGVRTFNDAKNFLEAGADRVSVNSAAVERSILIRELAERFGSQCIIVAIDAVRSGKYSWQVVTMGGRKRQNLDVVTWARTVEAMGAGEILLTSFDEDGRRQGYDTELISAVSSAVTIPVIASGGAFAFEHFDAGLKAGASALLAASLFHEQKATVRQLKDYLKTNWEVRPC